MEEILRISASAHRSFRDHTRTPAQNHTDRSSDSKTCISRRKQQVRYTSEAPTHFPYHAPANARPTLYSSSSLSSLSFELPSPLPSESRSIGSARALPLSRPGAWLSSVRSSGSDRAIRSEINEP